MSDTGNDHGFWIEIDLNVRIAGNRTFTYLPEEYAATLEVGAAYVVGESESQIYFPATLAVVKPDGYVEFDVEWSKGKSVL